MLDALLAALRGAKKLEWILFLAVVAIVVLFALSRAESAPRTALETRMERVLSEISGAGRVRVVLSEEERAESVFASESGGDDLRGAVIVAEGAGDVRVELELRRAAQALFGLEASRVEVFRMEEE